MKKNKNITFVTFILVEILLVIIAIAGLQFILFSSNKKLENVNLKVQTDVEQINSLSFVEEELAKEKLISNEISSYPTGEGAVNDFISNLQNFSNLSNCELYQVTVQSIVPVDITSKKEDGSVSTATSNINFSLATINVQIRANYSELIKFVSLLRGMKEIVGISASNFEIPLDFRNTNENFISLPIFFIFKTN